QLPVQTGQALCLRQADLHLRLRAWGLNREERMSNPKKSLSLSGQVHIDELPPEARKRVLSQIEGTAASEPKADTMSASNPRPTFEELKKAMLSHGLSIDGGGREELFRRLHHILFVSEHVRHIEEVTGRSYIDFCHGSLIRQVCRDRRNEREIMAAWKRGEKTYGGKRIGAHGQYVWRWEREDAQDALEMIEEALRDYPACATKADIMSASGPDTLSPRKRKYCPCPVCGHRFVSLLDDGTLGGHQRSDDPDPLCRGLVRCPASGTSPNTLSPGEEKTFRRFVALGKQVDKPLGKLIALGIEVRAIFARKPRGVPVQYAGQSYKDFEDFVSRNLPVSGRQMRRILAKEGKTDQRFANKLEPKSLPRNPEVGKIHVFDRKSVQDIVNRMPHIVGDGKLIGQYRSLFRDSEPPLPAGSYY